VSYVVSRGKQVDIYPETLSLEAQHHYIGRVMAENGNVKRGKVGSNHVQVPGAKERIDTAIV